MDWTIHIGLVVRNTADLIGFVTRFEKGSRKDAILRSTDGDEIAIEWEWEDILGKDGKLKGNELGKLKCHKVWSKDEGRERLLKYAVLITYTLTDAQNIEMVYNLVMKKWQGALWPLLLILINRVKSRKFGMRREFKNIQMSVFNEGEKVECRELRVAPAFPWEVPRTRWSYELK